MVKLKIQRFTLLTGETFLLGIKAGDCLVSGRLNDLGGTAVLCFFFSFLQGVEILPQVYQFSKTQNYLFP